MGVALLEIALREPLEMISTEGDVLAFVLSRSPGASLPPDMPPGLSSKRFAVLFQTPFVNLATAGAVPAETLDSVGENPCFRYLLLGATVLAAAFDARWGFQGLPLEQFRPLAAFAGADWARLSSALTRCLPA